MDEKKRTSQAEPEKIPTKLEYAEQTVGFVDYSLSQSEDLVHVVVAAAKTARALALALKGFQTDGEDSPTEEDFRLLSEMAVGLQLFCDQAKKLVGDRRAPGPPGVQGAPPHQASQEDFETAERASAYLDQQAAAPEEPSEAGW